MSSMDMPLSRSGQSATGLPHNMTAIGTTGVDMA